MINLIYFVGDEKHCRPISTLDDYIKACNTEENKKNWILYRQTGEERYKRALVQVNYNCQVADGGLLKGNKTVSPFFFYDIDCRSREECRQIINRLLQMKDELGLVEVSESASYGVHAVGRREKGKTILENQVRISFLTKTEMDLSNKENNRVVFHGPIDAETTPLIDEALLTERLSDEEAAAEYVRLKEREKKGLEDVPKGAKKANKHYRPWEESAAGLLPLSSCVPSVASGKPSGGSQRGSEQGNSEADKEADQTTPDPSYSGGECCAQTLAAFDLCAEQAGLKADRMDVWGEHNWHANLMAVLSVGVAKLMTRAQLMGVIAVRLPNYSQTEDCRKLVDYFYEKYDADKGFMNASLREINAKAQKEGLFRPPLAPPNLGGELEVEDEQLSTLNSQLASRKLPQGVKDSVEAVGESLAMPTVTAICPCIGALATGVRLDVHGDKRGLNLIAYIAGEYASGKGKIDPVVDAWMAEERTLNKMYEMQEEEWIGKKQAAKNKKEQPEELKLPWRYITLNNTVANLAQRLANTGGKHAFSFTPEADTVAEKWKSDMCNFSVMLRQSYDGSRYDREAKSADAVRVHIEHLLWNVTLCGTPDALYRVVSNYTDGFQSRIAVARTPDNTYARLEDKTPVLTERQTERIGQIAHLLPLMQGEVVLPKLEAKGREWLERIRMETMKNDDKTRARQRFRICVTAQRMTCCLMLCKVCEQLIQKHGLNGAETLLKQKPTLWKEMLVKTQTAQMLETYDVIADSLMDNALFFFRERIENAVNSRNYAGNQNDVRMRRGKNDSIYERLDQQFTFAQAMQQSVIEKGAGVTQNSVQQMLKNWRNQGLIVQTNNDTFRKN